jgi:hypothetical protein
MLCVTESITKLRNCTKMKLQITSLVDMQASNHLIHFCLHRMSLNRSLFVLT